MSSDWSLLAPVFTFSHIFGLCVVFLLHIVTMFALDCAFWPHFSVLYFTDFLF